MLRGATVMMLAACIGAAALARAPSTAVAQAEAVNQIVVYATFGNGSPPADSWMTVHVVCAAEGSSNENATVVDQTATFSPPFDPITFEVPVLAAGGPNTYVGCEVTRVQSSNLFGLPLDTCWVTEPGTPPPDPPQPSGCIALRSEVQAFFPATVSGAVSVVNFITLFAPTETPATTAAPAVVSAPAFTG
jgi:hypothetical protein